MKPNTVKLLPNNINFKFVANIFGWIPRTNKETNNQNNSIVGKVLREKYRITHKIGKEGGFGETFIAESLSSRDNKLYMVKKLKPTITDPRIWQQFSKEASVLSELGHLHRVIPEVFDYFEQNREFYLVQEYIDGHDLTQEIRPGKRWNETQTKEFLTQILEILSLVHDRRMLHMDIKPANIMRRNRDRQLMLIDFGAVKRTSTQIVENGEIRINPNTLVFSTPGYAPPEQLNCKPDFFSSDIYAVGITAIQALTGISAKELPTENGTIIWQNLVSDNISDNFAAFLNRMVSYDYNNRHKDARAALQELQDILDSPGGDGDEESDDSQPIPPTIPSLKFPNGPVPLNSPFYIERCTSDIYGDSTALRRIKCPKKWGKTSAAIRMIEYEAQQGFHTIHLNFRENFDRDAFQHLGIFLQKFCESIVLELNIKEPQNVAEYWQNSLAPSNKTKCRIYIENYVLKVINEPLVILLDEVDTVFGHSQVDAEFFSLLRVFSEKSASDKNSGSDESSASEKTVWQKLKMIIVHSQDYTEAYKNKSPFNVGRLIELPEFDESQIKKLLQQHGLNWEAEQIEQFIELLGGHPFMVRMALYKIANQEMTFSEFLQLAPTEAGPFAEDLLYHWENLEKHNLKTEYRKVLASTTPIQIDAQKANALKNMGLIKHDKNNPKDNKIKCFCKLYYLYFRQHLGLDK